MVLLDQTEISSEAFFSGILSTKWAEAQQKYHAKTGSGKCEVKWMVTLAEKVIDIVSDLWKHRNDALHHRDNVVCQRDHDKLNREIQDCIDQLLRSLRVFSVAE